MGVFRVKNHDFTQKKSYFFPILRGARSGCAPPLDPPLDRYQTYYIICVVFKNISNLYMQILKVLNIFTAVTCLLKYIYI